MTDKAELTAHPTPFELEAYTANVGPNLERTGHHVDSCTACQGYVKQLQEGHATLMARKPPAAFAHAVVQRANANENVVARWWRASKLRERWTFAVLGAAAAASVIAIVQRQEPLPSADSNATKSTPAIRMMGPPSVHAYIKPSTLNSPTDQAQSGKPYEIRERATVGQGDSLAVELSVSSQKHVIAFFLSERGTVNWWVPQSASEQALTLASGQHELPGSAVFDAAQEPERLIVVFDDNVIVGGPVAERFASAWKAAQSQGTSFTDDTWLPKEFVVWSLLLLKR